MKNQFSNDKLRKKTDLFFLAIITIFTFFFAINAYARLDTVGPINPQNNLPLYYQDSNGLALELGLDPAFNFFDPPDPANPFSVQVGFGPEAFYFLAESAIAMRNNNDAVLVLAIEAAWVTEEPIDGDQFVFARVRIRIDTPVAGTYTVTHPYGVKVYQNVPAGRRAINDTVDIGNPTPDFAAAALRGAIGPFLVAVNPPPPPGFIGDINIEQTVTGSPFNTNYFRIDGPQGSNLDGAGNDFIVSQLFSVSGKIFTGEVPTPVHVTRSTYERLGSDQVKIDVFADSAPTSALTVDIGLLPPVQMVTDGFGNFYSHILVRSTALPATISVTADNSPNNTPTTIIRPLVDLVSITRADYNATAKILVVEANSGDKGVPPVLTVSQFGDLVNGSLTVSNVLAPPYSITVLSSAGGSDITDTKVVEGNQFPIAVNDNVTTRLNTQLVINVLSNDIDPGDNGQLDVTSVTISAPPNTGGTATPNPDGTITYVPRLNFIGIDRFSYTVKDVDGAQSNKGLVTVVVTR